MSEIKVNKISPKTACGTTTLGDSGDTFTIPAGVTITNNGTQTGFGRTGSVDWQTSIKTGDFTAASGEGYFINTSGGVVTMTLPSSPSVGDIVAIKDYGSSFNDNNLTIDRNGSNLNGSAINTTRGTNNESLTLVYADATKGWMAVEEGTGFIGEAFVTATGGCITTSGNCKIHTFNSPGTFSVSQISSVAANNQVSYIVVAGGGGGGECRAGGGGAGGFREDKSPVTPYTASPLDGAGNISVTASDFPITVGAGGAGAASRCNAGSSGSNSIFSSITSAGGGGGGSDGSPGTPSGQGDGVPGGSGGGASNSGTKGNGNTPPVSPAQGFNGGCSSSGYTGSGGGGATAVGADAGPNSVDGGAGGAGATTSITASPVAYAGGGGGGGNSAVPRPAGAGGAGGGGAGTVPGPSTGGAGTANTGGGGGGNGGPAGCGAGGAGGSGVVIIRYKFQ